VSRPGPGGPSRAGGWRSNDPCRRGHVRIV